MKGHSLADHVIWMSLESLATRVRTGTRETGAPAYDAWNRRRKSCNRGRISPIERGTRLVFRDGSA